MDESWSFWELMGATSGPTRAELAQRINTMGRNGWDLALSLASVGSDGHWPHSMAVFRFKGTESLVSALDAGWADGMDERDIRWTKAKLARRLKGEFSPTHKAYLFEYLRCDAREILENYEAPDLVFADCFAPWQGIALWAADDLHGLAKREFEGIGSLNHPGVRQCTGWWAVIPQRGSV